MTIEEINNIDREDMTQGQKFNIHLFYKMNINPYCYFYSDCDQCGNDIKKLYDEVKKFIENGNK